MLGANPHPLEHGLISRVIPERRQVGIYTQKNTRAQVRLDHAFDMVQGLVGFVEKAMNDGTCEVDDRRSRRRERVHEFETFSPVTSRSRGPERIEQDGSVQTQSPAVLL